MTPIYWNTRFLGLFIYLALPLTKMADTRFWLEEQRMLMRSGKKEKTKGKTMRWKRSFEVSESARAGRPITFRVPRVLLLLLLLLCWKHSPTCHAVTNWTAGWPLEAERRRKTTRFITRPNQNQVGIKRKVHVWPRPLNLSYFSLQLV